MFTFKKSVSSVLVLATFLTATNAFAMNPGEEDKPGAARPAAVAPATAKPAAAQTQETESWGGWLYRNSVKIAVGTAAAGLAAVVTVKMVQANRAAEENRHIHEAAHQLPAAPADALSTAPSLDDVVQHEQAAAQDAQLDAMLANVQALHRQALAQSAALDAQAAKRK